MSRTQGNLVELDVRADLRKKIEPFQKIMEAVKTLEQDDMFVLHATFKPTPLLGVMKVRGYVNKVKKIEKDHWITTFVKKENKHWLNDTMSDGESIDDNIQSDQSIREDDCVAGAVKPLAAKNDSPKTIQLDNRGLEPPQPMIRTLSALERSLPGDEVWIHNDRIPVFLIEELKQLGYAFTMEEQTDGTAKAKIVKS